MDIEIEIPDYLTEPLLSLAAEQEVSVEDIVTRAIQNYMERNEDNAR